MRTCTVALALVLAACSKSGSTPTTSSLNPAPADGPADEPSAADRPDLTTAACEEQGGTVIGDIGDGAIHRPEYRCESGEPPIGSISAEPGRPIAVEGSVCCK